MPGIKKTRALSGEKDRHIHVTISESNYKKLNKYNHLFQYMQPDLEWTQAKVTDLALSELFVRLDGTYNP